MRPRRFSQLDVFSAVPLGGNPLALVHDAQGLSDTQMAAFARWTQLSETTFLLPPDDPAADCRVRIFTPGAGPRRPGVCRVCRARGRRHPDRRRGLRCVVSGMVSL